MRLLGLTGAVNLQQLGNELLQLIILESWQGGALGAVVQTLAVAIGAEETKLAVVSAVHLHALEALGGIMQHRGCWGDAEVLVGLDLGSLPALGRGPSHGDHVVSTVGVAQFLSGTGERHIAQVGGASDVEVRAIKLSNMRSDGTHNECM